MLFRGSSLRLIVALSVVMLAILSIQGIARADDSGAPIVARALTGLNVRSGPGLEFPRIGAMLAGQQVSLDGRSGDWFRFGYPNSPVKGWIERHLVKVTGDPRLLPDVTFVTNLVVLTPPADSAGVAETAPSAVVTATALANMVIRGGPGPQFEALGSLEKGQTVVIDGRSLDWYRFSYPNSFVKGWLSARFLKITGDVTKLLNVTFPPQ